MEWIEWIFNGIGTEIIVFLLGVVSGAAGHHFYQNSRSRQSQKAGDGAIQIQTNVRETGTPGASDGQAVSVGDYVYGNKIVSSEGSEFDICHFTRYSNAQIEGIILARGSNETLRIWCLELISNQRPDYLIRQCLEKMENNQEKYRLMEDLAKRGFADSEYFTQIGKSLTNSVYLSKAVKLCLSIGKADYAESFFRALRNNEYIFNSLTDIYGYDRNLFHKLYDDGTCFTSQTYREKMRSWLGQQQTPEETRPAPRPSTGGPAQGADDKQEGLRNNEEEP